MKKTVLMVAALLCAFACFSQVVDFENLTLEPNSSWIGADGTGKFTSSYLTLYNDYNSTWGSWQGFAYTNGTDTETNTSTNLSSCVGHGAGNSANYVTAFIGSDWMGDYSPIPVGIKINTELSGDFAHRGAYFCMPVLLKKYVDNSYAAHNYYYKLKASAYANGTLVGEQEIMMADFTEGHSYMMDDWTFVDFSWIENADSLNFIALSNDDAGGYGINTPAYFCMDNFGAQDPNYINYTDVVDFEEFDLESNTHWMGTEETETFQSSYLTFYTHYDEDWGTPYWEGFTYTNETDTETFDYDNLSSATGQGNNGSENYATCYMGWYNTAGIKIDTEHSGSFENRGAYFCLPAIVSLHMNTVDFAANNYYYKVIVTAYANGVELASRDIIMADYREGNSYKMDDWTFVDLSWIANADSLYFSADGNELNSYGLNTPTYFCMDDFGAENPGPVYVSNNIAESLSIDAYFDAAGMLNLNCESRINDVCVYDIAGRLVKAVSVNDNNVSMPFDVVNGMYIISARTEKGMATCKVINNR